MLAVSTKIEKVFSQGNYCAILKSTYAKPVLSVLGTLAANQLISIISSFAHQRQTAAEGKNNNKPPL